MIQKEIRELPLQEVIYDDDLFALDSDESNQTGKITYKQLLDKIRSDIFSEIQEIIDDVDEQGEHDQEQDQKISEMNTALLNICDKVYPVGSIYISLDSKDPTEIFGGEWQRIEDRFLFALGNTEKYGALGHPDGNSEVTLSAAQSGVQAHSHTFTYTSITGGSTTTGAAGAHKHWIQGDNDTIKSGSNYMRPKGWGNGKTTYAYDTSTSETHSHSVPAHTHSLNGATVANATAKSATSPVNIMPPYVIVNVWKRTKLASEVTTDTKPWDNIDETYQMAVFGDGETTSFRMTPGLIPRVVGVTVYDKYGNDITQEVHSQYSRTTVYTALDHESGESDVVFKTPLLDGYVAVLTFSQE